MKYCVKIEPSRENLIMNSEENDTDVLLPSSGIKEIEVLRRNIKVI